MRCTPSESEERHNKAMEPAAFDGLAMKSTACRRGSSPRRYADKRSYRVKLPIVGVTALLMGLAVLACHRDIQPNASAKSSTGLGPDAARAIIWIRQDGAIELDGKPTDLDAVEKALTNLTHRKGVVLYGRDSPSEEPHPNGMKVIDMVASKGLRIRMCVKRDCSDAMSPDERPRE